MHVDHVADEDHVGLRHQVAEADGFKRRRAYGNGGGRNERADED